MHLVVAWFVLRGPIRRRPGWCEIQEILLEAKTVHKLEAYFHH